MPNASFWAVDDGGGFAARVRADYRPTKGECVVWAATAVEALGKVRTAKRKARAASAAVAQGGR